MQLVPKVVGAEPYFLSSAPFLPALAHPIPCGMLGARAMYLGAPGMPTSLPPVRTPFVPDTTLPVPSVFHAFLHHGISRHMRL